MSRGRPPLNIDANDLARAYARVEGTVTLAALAAELRCDRSSVTNVLGRLQLTLEAVAARSRLFPPGISSDAQDGPMETPARLEPVAVCASCERPASVSAMVALTDRGRVIRRVHRPAPGVACHPVVLDLGHPARPSLGLAA